MLSRTRTLVIVAALASGASAVQASDVERLAASLARWKDARESCGGDYSYKVIRSSFTGARAETTVVVKANKVVERRFDTASPPLPGAPAPLKMEWSETGDDIGAHQGAAEPRTLDELYAIAKQIVEGKIPEHHVSSLGLDDRGLLQHCFVRDTRIQDDAPLAGVAPISLTLGGK
ncbi:MAG: hypothetical protein ACKOTB_14815 [Planctomycetia bacterium]